MPTAAMAAAASSSSNHGKGFRGADGQVDDDVDAPLPTERAEEIQRWIMEHRPRDGYERDCDRWNYSDRRSMQEVLPGLFLGPLAAATKSNVDRLHSEGVTHVVVVRSQQEARIIRPLFPDKFQYHVVDMEDSDSGALLRNVRPSNRFIRRALRQGGKVLIHGQIGASRSAGLAIAYVMEETGLSAKDATGLVFNIRQVVTLWPGFVRQLAELEPILLANRQIVEMGGPSKARGKKRALEEGEDDMDM